VSSRNGEVSTWVPGPVGGVARGEVLEDQGRRIKRGDLQLAKLSSLMNPASVAVVGASAHPQKVGNAVLRNLLNVGYPGAIYPINLREEEILGVKCYKTIGEVGPVDLAVICIPTKFVISAAEECGQVYRIRTGCKPLHYCIDCTPAVDQRYSEVGGDFQGTGREKDYGPLHPVCHSRAGRGSGLWYDYDGQKLGGYG